MTNERYIDITVAGLYFGKGEGSYSFVWGDCNFDDSGKSFTITVDGGNFYFYWLENGQLAIDYNYSDGGYIYYSRKTDYEEYRNNFYGEWIGVKWTQNEYFEKS